MITVIAMLTGFALVCFGGAVILKNIRLDAVGLFAELIGFGFFVGAAITTLLHMIICILT